MEVVGNADESGLPTTRSGDRAVRLVRRVGLNLVLIALGLLAAVLMLELLVRLFDPQLLYRYPKGLFVNDPITDYRLAPGFSGTLDTPEYSTEVHINSLGLRDSRELRTKLPGSRRILVLGDSFAMGHSVPEEQNFPRLVEDGLNAAAGHPTFTVLSSGVPGYNTRQELSYLLSRGFELDPDAVVLAFFVGNDVADNSDFKRHYRVIDGYLTNGDSTSGALPLSVQSFLALHSELYHLLWPLQHKLRGLPAAKTEDPLAPCRVDANPSLWRPTEELIRDMAAAVRARGLPFFVVLIPDMVQVDHESWDQATQGREGVDPTVPGQRLTAIATTNEIPVLDLYPALKAAQTRGPLYYRKDHHFTATGNRIAADAMTPFLWEHLSTLQ
jgi:lysophospholipase L1-like esterase